MLFDSTFLWQICLYHLHMFVKTIFQKGRDVGSIYGWVGKMGAFLHLWPKIRGHAPPTPSSYTPVERCIVTVLFSFLISLIVNCVQISLSSFVRILDSLFCLQSFAGSKYFTVKYACSRAKMIGAKYLGIFSLFCLNVQKTPKYPTGFSIAFVKPLPQFSLLLSWKTRHNAIVLSKSLVFSTKSSFSSFVDSCFLFRHQER